MLNHDLAMATRLENEKKKGFEKPFPSPHWGTQGDPEFGDVSSKTVVPKSGTLSSKLLV